jgi:hypothetical protein
MRTPNKEIDSVDTYLDLIGELDEIAIQIVGEHAIFESAYEAIEPVRTKYVDAMNANNKRLTEDRGRLSPDDVAELEAENKVCQEKIDTYNREVQSKQAFRKSEYFNISDKDFLYYKQFLSAKGLIVDVQYGIGGGVPFAFPRITELGKRFITFILG